jgi:hypothetical protein
LEISRLQPADVLHCPDFQLADTASQKSNDHFIELHDVPGGATTIDLPLDHLYTGEYMKLATVEDEFYTYNVGVFIFADRYDIPDLAELASGAYHETICNHAQYPDQFECHADLFHAVQMVYNSCQTGSKIHELTGVMLPWFGIFTNAKANAREAFRKAASGIPDLLVQMCDNFAKHHDALRAELAKPKVTIKVAS